MIRYRYSILLLLIFSCACKEDPLYINGEITNITRYSDNINDDRCIYTVTRNSHGSYCNLIAPCELFEVNSSLIDYIDTTVNAKTRALKLMLTKKEQLKKDSLKNIMNNKIDSLLNELLKQENIKDG